MYSNGYCVKGLSFLNAFYLSSSGYNAKCFDSNVYISGYSTNTKQRCFNHKCGIDGTGKQFIEVIVGN